MLSLGRGLSPILRSLTPSDPSMLSIASSCVFDLDATMATSYPGSGQYWYNIVPAPADGSPKATYHATLGLGSGVAAEDPTFNGTAGDSAAYFSNDGDDRFQITPGTDLFYKNISTTQPFSIAVCFKTGPSITAGTNVSDFFQNGAYTGTVGGMTFRISSTTLIMTMGNGSGVTNNTITQSFSTNTDYCMVYTYDPNTGAYKIFLNSLTPTTGTKTATGGGTAGTQNMVLFRSWDSGARHYAMSLYNAALSDAEAADVIAAYNSRHGRTYA